MPESNQTIESSCVRVIPLGGLGEIGLNMMVLECAETIVLIDAGLMFPEDDMLGIDIVIPDFSYLRLNKDRLKALIVTHGHEDHIGRIGIRQGRAPGHQAIGHGLFPDAVEIQACTVITEGH